jgi:hypothetical protein
MCQHHTPHAACTSTRKHEHMQRKHEHMQRKHEHMQRKHEHMQRKHEHMQRKHEHMQRKHEHMQRPGSLDTAVQRSDSAPPQCGGRSADRAPSTPGLVNARPQGPRPHVWSLPSADRPPVHLPPVLILLQAHTQDLLPTQPPYSIHHTAAIHHTPCSPGAAPQQPHSAAGATWSLRSHHCQGRPAVRAQTAGGRVRHRTAPSARLAVLPTPPSAAAAVPLRASYERPQPPVLGHPQGHAGGRGRRH